ncbi:uncharacterized protein LOC126979448 isoform X1 [Leptidea sinapis]|uniref:uncharacterized protein LOC126979448 isoform X1 n=1 Tax=Leptidea sinapis TaxID=189913 RepID=UPI002129E686|nr:uncharacterized protein LOC126979448 isoform X1 [Leptidea sinapis]
MVARYKYILYVLPVIVAVLLVAILLGLFLKPESSYLGPKIVIDHDGGADDAIAILIALINEKYFSGPNVVALTTVHGNVNESQVFINSQRILDVADRSDVPIYRGSAEPLISGIMSDFYFGFDGLGDNEIETFKRTEAQLEHAALGLIELSKKYSGELTIVAIGALTNIALAIRLDPEFIQRLAHLYIGAGHIYSERFNKPEFNAAMDVEAYEIALSDSTPDDVTLLPFSQVLQDLDIDKNWRTDVLGAIPNNIVRSLNAFERVSLQSSANWSLLDPAVMAIVLEKSIVDETKCSLNSIILCDEYRGINTNNFTSETPNSEVVYKLNKENYKKFLLEIFSAPENNVKASQETA